jgi:hypothetical protein
MQYLAFFAVAIAPAFAQDGAESGAIETPEQSQPQNQPVIEVPAEATPEPEPIPEPPPGAIPLPPAGETAPSAEAIALLDDSTYFEPDPRRRLHAWLAFNSDRMELSRTIAGALIIGLGGLVVGAGIASLFAEDVVLRDAFAISFGVLGFMSIGLGVGIVALSTPPEDRFERWRERWRSGPVDDFELGRFEGEFYADVETAKFNRYVSGALGFAVAGAGLLTAASSSFFFVEDDEDAGLIAITGGLTFTIIGSILGALAFAIESPIERDWERYRVGLAPNEDASPMF